MEPDFLTLAEILSLHQQQLDAYGGIDGIRDHGLLESALAMPQATLAKDIVGTFGGSAFEPASGA